MPTGNTKARTTIWYLHQLLQGLRVKYSGDCSY